MTQIAVLIPTYKPGSYLEECLECFEAQTLSKDNFHVYIVLNGPGAGYKDYVKMLVEKFTFQVSYSYLPEAGVSNARNYLIEHSESEYVVFVDDDDLVSEDYLEKLLAASSKCFMGISNVKDFESDISQTTASYIGKCFDSISGTEKSKFVTRKYYSSPVAKMLHRNMILKNRFNISLAIGEDSLFMAEISPNISGVIKAEPTATYFVRQRAGSATRSDVKRVEEIKRVFHLLFIYFKMFFSFKYNSVFIITRMIATLMHLRRIF